MHRIFANLYRIDSNPRGKATSYSYLLIRKAGNLLICNQRSLVTDHLDEIEALGGIHMQFISSYIDAKRVRSTKSSTSALAATSATTRPSIRWPAPRRSARRSPSGMRDCSSAPISKPITFRIDVRTETASSAGSTEASTACSRARWSPRSTLVGVWSSTPSSRPDKRF